MVQAYACRPEAAYLLEMKGGVPRITLQVFVGPICGALNIRGERVVKRPESGRGAVLQMGLVLPAACSRNASSARASSLPA